MRSNRHRKLTSAAFNVVPCDKERQELEERRIREAYMRTCPNDGMKLTPSDDPNLDGCLECSKCGFVYKSTKILVHVESGTVSQVADEWGRLAREDEEPN